MSATSKVFRQMTTTSSTVVSRQSSRDSSRSSVKRKARSIILPMSQRSSPVSPRSSPIKTVSETLFSSELVQFTPPDQVIPNTGGRYEDWEFHPSRLNAVREELNSEHSHAEAAGQSDGSAAGDHGESVSNRNESDEDDVHLKDKWNQVPCIILDTANNASNQVADRDAVKR
jgi:hypothetical protein